MTRSLAAALAAALAAGILLPGCAPAGKPAAEQTAAPAPGGFLAPEDFAKSLDPLVEARLRNPKDRALEDRCLRTAEAVKRAADRAAAAKDYAMAQAGYRVLKANFGAFEDLAPRLSFSKADVDVGLKFASIYYADARYLKAVAAADYPQALEVYRLLLADYPADAVVRGKYAGAAREVRSAGARALDAKDYAKAGSIYALLLRNFVSLERLGPELGFSRADLTKAIAACRNRLNTTALAEYRKGNVSQAVAIWQSLLAFDPDNAEVKKALETAKIQMREAEKKK